MHASQYSVLEVSGAESPAWTTETISAVAAFRAAPITLAFNARLKFP